jgi:hypothetical protein
MKDYKDYEAIHEFEEQTKRIELPADVVDVHGEIVA